MVIGWKEIGRDYKEEDGIGWKEWRFGGMELNGMERNRMGSYGKEWNDDWVERNWMMRNEMGRDEKEWNGIGLHGWTRE